MKVAIIGGGPSGLTSAKSCLEANLVPTVFERDLTLGGLWKLGSGGRTWTSLKTNLSKHTCCFSDFFWPDTAPTFPSSAQVREYIGTYASHFDLKQYVRLGHAVVRVSSSANGGWEVAFTSTAGIQQTEVFDKCIVACGIFSQPFFPPPCKVEGITTAIEEGWATHGGAYRNPDFCAGKSVLVVGCAFSGSEIAADSCGTAARCIVATGRPSVFLPRFIGKPASPSSTRTKVRTRRARDGDGEDAPGGADCDHSADTGDDPTAAMNKGCSPTAQHGRHEARLATCLVPLDLALYSRKGRAVFNAAVTPVAEKRENMRRILLRLAGRDPGDVHKELRLESDIQATPRVIVSDHFLDKVLAGSIEVRPRLVALDAVGRKAHFSDASVEPVDHVIFCTGLRPCLKFLPPEVLAQLEHNASDSLQPLILQHQTWNQYVPDIAFVGVYRGPYFGAMELQARWVTRMWSGVVQPPLPIRSEAALQESRDIRNAQPRPQFPTNYVDLMEALADMAGLIPLKDEMPVGADPEVVRKWLWSGPLLPCHYRICQDSTHGLSAPIPLCASTDSEGSSAFTGALAEIRKVNTALEDQVFSP